MYQSRWGLPSGITNSQVGAVDGLGGVRRMVIWPSWTAVWWNWQSRIRLSRSVGPPSAQWTRWWAFRWWVWWQPVNWQRAWSRIIRARRRARVTRRRVRPRARTPRWVSRMAPSRSVSQACLRAVSGSIPPTPWRWQVGSTGSCTGWWSDVPAGTLSSVLVSWSAWTWTTTRDRSSPERSSGVVFTKTRAMSRIASADVYAGVVSVVSGDASTCGGVPYWSLAALRAASRIAASSVGRRRRMSTVPFSRVVQVSPRLRSCLIRVPAAVR